MKVGGIYSASDKAMFDALNQTKVTKDDINELMLKRGTIISGKTGRDKIAKYYSTFFHDFYDYQSLSEILGTNTQREKVTSRALVTKLNIKDIENFAHEVMEEIEKSDDAIISLNKNKTSIYIKAQYRTTNFNKTEFRQVVDREATIEIHQDSDGFIIRYPNNTTVAEWNDKLIERLKQESTVEETFISLLSVTNPELRSRFFSRLIKGMKGYTSDDVTDVFVYHPKPKSLDEEDAEDIGAPIEGVHISKATLKGERVLNSSEIQGLFDKGFFISRITWTAIKNEPGSDKYIFEAQVSNPEDFSGFSYICKGFYKRKEFNEFSTNRSPVSSFEEQKFYRLIENAARKICDEIIDEAGSDGANNDQ